MPWRPRQLAYLTACLVVLALIAWGWTLGDTFLADDFARFHEARKAATPFHALRLHPGAGEHMFVRPLLFLTFWLDQRLFGAAPLGWRLVNLGLHVTNALLVAVLVRNATDSLRAAWLASLAFVIFPLHAEAVVWISGRVDVLCATGCLAALCAWQRFLRPPPQMGRWPHLVLACVCFAAGLLAKEMAITVPLLALALAWRPGQRFEPRAWIGVAALGGVAGVYMVARFALLGGLGGYRPGGASLHALPSVEPVARNVVRAFRFLAVPTHRELYTAAWDPVRLGSVLAFLGAWSLAWARDRARAFGLAWRGALLVLVSLLPVAGWAFLPDDNQLTRMLYLPSAFACGAVGGALALASDGRTRSAVAASVLLLGAYLLGSVRAAWLWHGSSELVRADVALIREACRDRTGVELVVTGFPKQRHGTQMWNNALFAEAAWLPRGVTRVTVLGWHEWSRRLALDQAGAGSARVFLRRSSELGVVRDLAPERGAPRTNALGLYDDEETARQPRAGCIRVLVAGADDLVRVEANRESMASVLEELLNARFGAQRFEVLNAGAGATAESVQRLLDLDPELLVLVVKCGRVFLEAGPVPFDSAEARRAYEHGLRAALDVDSAAVEQTLQQVAYLKAIPAAPAAATELARARISTVKALCDAHAVELVLVMLPSLIDTQPHLDQEGTLAAMEALGLEPSDLGVHRELVRKLIAWAASAGIAVIDLQPVLARVSEPWFRALDHRLDARGQRRVAELVLDGWLSGFERLAR